MAKKIREQSISLVSYLSKVKEDDISDNQDVQRSFCWDNNAVNELIVTVLTDDYIPPVILGEEELGGGVVQQYIVDGMQRSSALVLFRYGNYKITSSVENSIIKYQKKKRDKNNVICKDNSGSVVWDYEEFDIKGKTFEMLPDELKKKFDDYQIKIAVHQNCTMEQISKLVRRYNNHRAMNASQKAFTYLDMYARKVKTLSQCSFFKNCTTYSDTERKKGTYEKLVCESVMAVNHLDKWKKSPKQMNIFLNSNSSDKEFERFSEYAARLEKVCQNKFSEVFVPKDICVWFAVFDKFTKLNPNKENSAYTANCKHSVSGRKPSDSSRFDDSRFADFIQNLVDELHSREINGLTFDSLCKKSGTKDKKIITEKIDTLYALMIDYLYSSKSLK